MTAPGAEHDTPSPSRARRMNGVLLRGDRIHARDRTARDRGKGGGRRHGAGISTVSRDGDRCRCSRRDTSPPWCSRNRVSARPPSKNDECGGPACSRPATSKTALPSASMPDNRVPAAGAQAWPTGMDRDCRKTAGPPCHESLSVRCAAARPRCGRRRMHVLRRAGAASAAAAGAAVDLDPGNASIQPLKRKTGSHRYPSSRRSRRCGRAPCWRRARA